MAQAHAARRKTRRAGDQLASMDRLPEVDPVDRDGHGGATGVPHRSHGGGTVDHGEQLADLAGVSLRTLQRRFHAYVGIGPKWVVQRFRLLDVTAVAHAGGDVDWAGLAARLGYADQSHLIRAFTRLVGHPPATYAREA